MAEIFEQKISVLEWRCLGRRIGEIEALRQEVMAWVQARNEAQATFTSISSGMFVTIWPAHTNKTKNC
ncbi:MAG: hypothetical protein QXP27_10070 [Candidatus Methanomethyliaceae archaeon]